VSADVRGGEVEKALPIQVRKSALDPTDPPLLDVSTMNYWIFQVKPERFDMAGDSRFRSGSRARWQATRHRTEMSPGDIAYFWQAGESDTRGIYGWGRIVSEPYMEGESYFVDVEYVRKLSDHISSRAIEKHNALSNLMLLRLAIGTELFSKVVDRPLRG
jgi:predicted RNA-binding protein with PUA-like domain